MEADPDIPVRAKILACTIWVVMGVLLLHGGSQALCYVWRAADPD